MKILFRNPRLFNLTPFESLENRQLLSACKFPLAIDDFYFAPSNQSLQINAREGLLANDVNVNSSAKFTPVLVEAPANGVVVIDKNGGFVYTPNKGYAGDDGFTYAFKGDPANIAWVSINVVDAPIAMDDSYSGVSGRPLFVSKENGVLDNDVNFAGKNVTVSLVEAPANGFLRLNYNGAFYYVPNRGFEGEDSFTYAIDGTDSVATANISFSQLKIEYTHDRFSNSTEDETIVVRAKPVNQKVKPDAGHANSPITGKSSLLGGRSSACDALFAANKLII